MTIRDFTYTITDARYTRGMNYVEIKDADTGEVVRAWTDGYGDEYIASKLEEKRQEIIDMINSDIPYWMIAVSVMGIPEY